MEFLVKSIGLCMDEIMFADEIDHHNVMGLTKGNE
jgi:hypothetical protein